MYQVCVETCNEKIGEKPIVSRRSLGSEQVLFMYNCVITDEHSPTPSQTWRGLSEKRTSKSKLTEDLMEFSFLTLTATTGRITIRFHVIGTLPRPCAISTIFPLTAFARGLDVRLTDFYKRFHIQVRLQLLCMHFQKKKRTRETTVQNSPGVEL